jgi:phytoene desaturase
MHMADRRAATRDRNGAGGPDGGRARRGSESAWDVIVVGAGPGGLSTAMLLAGAGLRTLLLEQKHVPGGRMGRIEGRTEEGTYTLDTGPTILQLPHVLEQIFARSGASFADYVTLEKVDPNTRIHFWDGSALSTWTSAEKNRAEWSRFVKDGAARFDRFFAEHTAKYRIAYDRFIAHDASSPLDYYNPLRLLPAARFAPWESLYTSLMRSVGDERLAYALSYPSKYLGLHPTTCSSVFSVIAFLELAFGVWHVRGGFRALADAMAKAFEDRGGEVRYGAGVRRVLVEEHAGRRATKGVLLDDGTVLSAEHVVVNADWALAKQRLVEPEHRPSHPDRRIERAAYSCSTFMLYLGLDRRYEDVPHHAIYLSRGATRTDRDALEDRTIDEDDPPFYVCNPCVTDPSGAPAGHSTLYVLVPCPNTGHAVPWSGVRERFAQKTLERLAKVGIRDAAKHVRMMRIADAETWRDDFGVFRGAVFNLAHTWLQLGPLRPGTRDPDVENLHWVGGGTHPGSGLLTIFESANIAATNVTQAFGGTLVPSRAPDVGEEFRAIVRAAQPRRTASAASSLAP